MDSRISGIGANFPFGMKESSDRSRKGLYCHRKATAGSTDKAIQNKGSSADSLEKPTLKDRLVYPLKATRNRIYTTMLTGGSAGVFLGMGVGVGVGTTAGFTAGMIPQVLDLLTFSCEPYVIAGALVGKEVGIRGGAVLGLGIGGLATLASAGIGLALSVVEIPKVIYHAATLDKPGLDAPLPQKPWIARKLSQELSELN